MKTQTTPRQYFFTLTFTVGRRERAVLEIDGKKKRTPKRTKKGKVRMQRGYDITVEVKAATKKGAAQKIRNRIAKMPDVAEVPVFHFEDVTRGRHVLLAGGHDHESRCDFNRGKKVAVTNTLPEREFSADEITAAAMRRRTGNCASF